MKKWILISVIIGSVFLVLLVLLAVFHIFGMSGGVCEVVGGRVSGDQGIVGNYSFGNSSAPIFGAVCKENEINIGSVRGRKCDCICCATK